MNGVLSETFLDFTYSCFFFSVYVCVLSFVCVCVCVCSNVVWNLLVIIFTNNFFYLFCVCVYIYIYMYVCLYLCVYIIHVLFNFDLYLAIKFFLLFGVMCSH